MEIQELKKHLHEEISEEINKFVLERVFKYSRYLFIKKGEEVYHINWDLTREKIISYDGYCTHCKQTFNIDELELKYDYKHNSVTECPLCKSRVTVKHAKYKRTKLIDSAIFITYRNSKIDNNVLLCEGYFVTRNYSGDYKAVETKYSKLNTYVLMYGKAYIIRRDGRGTEYLAKGYVNYKDYMGNYRSYIDYLSLYEAAEKTYLKYTNYKNRVGRHYFDGTLELYNYSKYPIIEKLEKVGLEDIANRMIEGRSINGAVNWKRQDDIFKFTGLNKGELKEIKRQYEKITPKILKIYKINKKQKLKLTVEEIKEIEDVYEILNNKYLKLTNLKKIYKYLVKQRECIKSTGTLTGTVGIGVLTDYRIMQEWVDYLEMYENNFKDPEEDLTETIMFPRNIIKAHEEIIKKVKIKTSRELNKKVKDLINKNKKYEYEFKNLIVRVPQSMKEIEIEGKKLHHCVYANYSKPYANGQTVILFIRHKDDLNTPYYTMEIKGNRISQCYGKNNSGATYDVKEMLEKYKVDILKIKSNQRIA